MVNKETTRTDNPAAYERCAFGYLATAEKPCWGELMVNDDSGEDWIWSCEGHLMCSMYFGTSDEENLRRYDPIERGKENA